MIIESLRQLERWKGRQTRFKVRKFILKHLLLNEECISLVGKVSLKTRFTGGYKEGRERCAWQVLWDHIENITIEMGSFVFFDYNSLDFFLGRRRLKLHRSVFPTFLVFRWVHVAWGRGSNLLRNILCPLLSFWDQVRWLGCWCCAMIAADRFLSYNSLMLSWFSCLSRSQSRDRAPVVKSCASLIISFRDSASVTWCLFNMSLRRLLLK